MPFQVALSNILWPWQMYVSGDTVPGFGASLNKGFKRGFGGCLVPTLNLLQMLQGRDFATMPLGFTVPAGTSMFVLMSFNAQENQWTAIDGAGDASIHQRIDHNNSVSTVFGHTFCGSWREWDHFSEASIAYVQSGNEHFFAHVCLNQHLQPQNTPLALNTAYTYALNPVDTSGGLDMYGAPQSTDLQVDYEYFGLDSADGEQDSAGFRYHDMHLESFFIDPADLDTMDDDRMSMATTPVASMQEDTHGRPEQDLCIQLNFSKDLPEALDFSSVVSDDILHDACVQSVVEPVVCLNTEVVTKIDVRETRNAEGKGFDEVNMPEIDVDMPRKKICLHANDGMPTGAVIEPLVLPVMLSVGLDMSRVQKVVPAKLSAETTSDEQGSNDKEAKKPFKHNMHVMTCIEQNMKLSCDIAGLLQRFEALRQKLCGERGKVPCLM